MAIQKGSEGDQEQRTRRPKFAGPLKRRANRLRAWLKQRPALSRFVQTVAFLLLVRFGYLLGSGKIFAAPVKPVELSYGAFLAIVKRTPGAISGLRINLARYSFLLDGEPAFTRPVKAAPQTVEFLREHGVDFIADRSGSVLGYFTSLLPFVWFAALYNLYRKQMGGGERSVAQRAASLRPEDFSFDDVAGINTARDEVQEVVQILQFPERYAAAGARLPSGVLLVGPPGTGKTLLARVLAAQAGVPFFYCSGSDFIEVFVGRGAARMRKLFKQAQAAAPALLFIDEVDVLGKRRGLGGFGTNDESLQTLNQMLACMDGLGNENSGVVVIAATNRAEILDPALTRPGRFDRLVRVELPDDQGRAAILRVHTRQLALGADVDLNVLALRTPNFSGAELAALSNEAAIRSVRRLGMQDGEVVQADFLEALSTFKASRTPLAAQVDSLLDGLSKRWGPEGQNA